MGTGFDTVTSEEEQGIIPRAIAHLFRGIDERKRRAQEQGVTGPEFKVSAQFLEVCDEGGREENVSKPKTIEAGAPISVEK